MKTTGEHFYVLYIITKLELGGAQKVCLTLFNGLSQQGYISGLVSGDQGVLVPEVSGDPHVHLFKELKREIGFLSFWSEIKTFFHMYKLIRRLKKEHEHLIVHTHSTKAGVLGRWAAFFARAKTRVHTVHGFGFNDTQSRPWWLICFLIEYITSLVTSHYVCVSKKDRHIGLRYFPFFAQKSSLIRAAVEWDKFYIPARTEKKPTQAIVIGTISCLKPQKNVIDLIRAFKHVYDHVEPSLQHRLFLHIIGDGILRPQLEKIVQSYQLQEHIIFLGWQQDVSIYLKGWDIFAMSSLWEGLPCAIVEARLAKVPVITYQVGGVDEVIFDGLNGHIIPCGDWKSLSQSLQMLVQDDKKRLAMAHYHDNLGDFKNTHMIQEHTDLYKNLLQR